MIQTLKDWLKEIGATELPCGCMAPDGRPPRFSDYSTVVNWQSQTTREREYRNCTRSDYEWMITIRCDRCGATWKTRRSGGTKVDYGDENPDAEMKLEVKRLGATRITEYNEVPIVQDAATRERDGDD